MDPSLRSMRTVMRISSGRSVSLVVTPNGCPQASACWGLVLSKEVKYKILKCRVSKAQLIFTLWNFYLYNAFPDLYRQKVFHPEPHSGLLEICHQYLVFFSRFFEMSSEYLYTLHCLILTSYFSVSVQLNINDLLLSLKLRRCRRCRSFSLNQLRSTSDCNCSTWYTRYIFNPMVNIHPINHLFRNIHI